ncbi:MAG: hypothetical protein ACW99A_16790 [Candidatus Kariarchaeaceae archaeon]|jgi:hypothetical protein
MLVDSFKPSYLIKTYYILIVIFIGILLTKENEKWALSSVKKPDLEDEQWFPDNPANPPSKWSFLIALIDEVAIVILIIVVVYVLFIT